MDIRELLVHMRSGSSNRQIAKDMGIDRHTVAIALREADKRGFHQGSGKVIQIVTDGDNDLERYINEYFPEAEHPTDVYHLMEYIWEAGCCLHSEGNAELVEWVEEQKEALYDGRAAEIVEEIDKQLKRLDPSKQSVRERLEKMNYDELRERDLEISSGAMEGAVNYVIAKRFDSNGMCWAKERAEHLLQLRCIEVNGDWGTFIQFVQDKTKEQAHQQQQNLSLKRTKPAPLPTYGLIWCLRECW